ncbi:MAG: hypothetical protein RL563_1470, partial [Pseudomonadota bacterium]
AQDVMTGGLGDDEYWVDNVKDQVIEQANEGLDSIYSSISFSLPNDVENLVLLEAKALKVTGNDLNNSLQGNTKANTLQGKAGADNLTGGAGKDTFMYLSVDDSMASKPDTITDFSPGDKINLKAIDAKAATAKNEAFTFIGEATFTQAGQLRFAEGQLQADVNGDGQADFLIALTGVTSIAKTAIVL